MTHLLEVSEENTSAQGLNGLSLAFIGDSVFEILVREHLLENGSMPVGKLHSLAVKVVNASAQARFFDLLEPLLSEEETSALHRGRNASATHVPKGAYAIEYRKATGLEALFGWLYLKGQNERLRELFDVILAKLSEEVEDGHE